MGKLKLFCKHSWQYYNEKSVPIEKYHKISDVIGSMRECKKCGKTEVFVPVVSVVNAKEILKRFGKNVKK